MSRIKQFLNEFETMMRMKKNMHEKQTKHWFSVTVPDDCEGGCAYLNETTDTSATGDSPTCYECICVAAKYCPRVKELMA